MATEQLKQQMIKELDDLELKTERGMYWVRLDSVRDIVNSLIDKTAQMTDQRWINQPSNAHDERIRQHERERIMGIIEKRKEEMIESTGVFRYDGIYEDIISTITAKSDNNT